MTGTTCYWCGENADGGKEHVPPKGFFPKGYRNQLITVPSCRKHNEELHQVDEAARALVSLIASFYKDFGIASIPSESAINTSIRSLLRNRASLANRLLSDIRGQFTRIDTDVLNHGVEKIVRGLHFHKFKTPSLAKEYHVICDSLVMEEDGQIKWPDPGKSMRERFEQLKPAWNGDNPDVFSYQILKANSVSCFRMIFYECVEFIAFPEISLGAQFAHYAFNSACKEISDRWEPHN